MTTYEYTTQDVEYLRHGDRRFMARLFMNPALYLEMYLQALVKKFGEEAAVQQK